MNGKKFKITFNSPVVIGFTIVCFAALILSFITDGMTNYLFFSVYSSSLLDPLTYIRFFGHVVGHSGWEHFCGNIMLFLVTGTLLEEKYGSINILLVILITAFITGLIHFIFFPGIMLLGASGVVFAFILLSSFTDIKEGEIPLTLILVALFYFSGQIYDGLFVQDNVANLTHIIGGVTGAALGFVMQKNKTQKIKL